MPNEFVSRPARVSASAVIERFWELRADGAEDAANHISPDGRCEMVVHLSAPPERFLGASKAHGGNAVCFGPINCALTVRERGASFVRAIRFQPSGLFALGRAPEQWRGIGAAPRDVLGELGERFEAVARNAPDFESFASACETLASKARAEIMPDLSALIGRIERGETKTQSELAAMSGWSGRHVARLVRQQTGHTPNELMRIARFHRARRRVVRTIAPLADIAARADYADQSHMIHDFKRFARASPTELRHNCRVYDAIF